MSNRDPGVVAQYVKECVVARIEALNTTLDAYYFADDDKVVRPKHINVRQHGEELAIPLISIVKPKVVVPKEMTVTIGKEMEATLIMGEEDCGEALEVLIEHHNRHLRAQTESRPLRHLLHEEAPPEEPEQELAETQEEATSTDHPKDAD